MEAEVRRRDTSGQECGPSQARGEGFWTPVKEEAFWRRKDPESAEQKDMATRSRVQPPATFVREEGTCLPGSFLKQEARRRCSVMTLCLPRALPDARGTLSVFTSRLCRREGDPDCVDRGPCALREKP
ncbi:uncharacterized protein LOC143651849 [Tamandua tetradactyla]|uniref:uncharacterized protein LOC143651849 n=1 Tax=Tamandua tetradactyla TaxID=48850 RepID=UPI00405447C4